VTIDISQTRLPGVGTRYSFTSARGKRLSVIRHNDGLCEIYVFAGAVLGPIDRKRLIIAAVFAVVAAFTLDFMFRTVFQLDLT